VVTPQVVCTFPDFPLRLDRSVASGGWGDAPPVPSPVEVRVDATGNLWVTNGFQRIVRCGGSGGIDVPADGGPLRDFAVGSGYGLLFADGLRWSSGWQLDGDFGKILTDGGCLYLSERHGPALFELDITTGDLRRTLLRSPDAGRPFLAGGRICSVFTDVDAEQRGIEIISSAGAVNRIAMPGTEHYAALVHTIGFDKDIRGYAISDGTITRFSRTGELERWASVPADIPPASFQVDAGGRVIYATAATDGVTVLSVGG
jgi:hypothetical protein